MITKDKDNVMTMEDPFDDKWFVFCRNIMYCDVDSYDYEKRHEICRKLARIAKYVSENDVIGDPMLTESFIGCVECGGFTDYDGFAKYVSYDTLEEREYPVYLNLSDLKKHIDTDFVIWYNK